MNNMLIKVVPFELKAEDDGEQGQFCGYGSVFGNRDSYGDVVMPGAFSGTLSRSKAKDIKMLWQHDTTQPIGVYDEISEDAKGLKLKGRLAINGVPKAREAYELMKMGALSGLSIGYYINPKGARYDMNDNTTYLSDLNLMEVSIVTFPANVEAQASVIKSAHELVGNIREFENFLRDAGGYSRNEAKQIAFRCFKVDLRDADESDPDAKRLDDAISKAILELSSLRGI